MFSLLRSPMTTSTKSGVSIHYDTDVVCKMTLEIDNDVDGLGWVVASVDFDDESYSECHC